MTEQSMLSGEGEGPQTITDSQEAVNHVGATVHTRRRLPRIPCAGVHLCFSPELPAGETEHVECPVIDKSASGFRVGYDRFLEVGTRGHVAYLTVGQQLVRVSCTVRHCTPQPDGRYLVGLKLDRLLSFEEKRLARTLISRKVLPDVQLRKISEPRLANPTN